MIGFCRLEAAELTIVLVVRVIRSGPAFAPFTCKTYSVMWTMLSLPVRAALLKRELGLLKASYKLGSGL